ncbi:LOW QUALITY PROTEIN: hypothetical protein CFC21_099326 [Triticum aestivum]|uniref:VWFA domain-containing protein n=2 Tax=Triticum aestivum TaxID=4565 RepID=A0A3B6RP47_WHEAT|nr:LOW QUALITY PROTEIN: hypothetical protein CFC21_099326 [Triticum aestivum]
MADTGDADVCAICLGGMVRGQASYTAECSHAFHLICISASVAHGNHTCPLCKAPWTVLPAVNAPAQAAAPSSPSSSSQQVPRTYDDDEPTVGAQTAAATNGGAVVLRTHCECPAVARAAVRENFAVLVHARAPSSAASEAARAPLDLVTVLDVSGSMTGRKLALLKQAMGFVIDNLGSADRLSVSFSNSASRLIRLVRMSDAGKAAAKRAVESLAANGGTNIGEGLRVAAQVFGDRQHMNAVASIMLLSDGQDTFTAPRRHRSGAAPNYIRGAGARPPAVHAFGFGTDHDAAAMHTIAEATGGTFSFIENEAVVQDSFAQCIGGLLTVTVQELRIAVTCLHPSVLVRAVKSGRYDNRVDAGGRSASVDVGELYADEERRFLIFLDVPGAEDAVDVTGLVKASCTYRDAATGQAATLAGDDAVVQRPIEAADVRPSMEVERERVRVEATEDMAAAREAADREQHAEGARILRGRLEAVERSAPGMAGDPMCKELEDELRVLIAGVEDRREYETTGRACFLSGMSSHGQQRAATRQLQTASMPTAYVTPAMEKMVKKSREQRQTGAAEPPPPPNRKRVKGQQLDGESEERSEEA